MNRLLGKEGTVADGAAADITSAKLLDSAAGDCPQKFSDFLAQIAGRALLQIELKHQRDTTGTQLLARAVAEALKAYEGPVTVESFDPHLLTAIRQFGFAGPPGLITYDYKPDGWDSPLNEAQSPTPRPLRHFTKT